MTQFVSHSPWYVYLLCFLGALGLTALLYYRNPSNQEIPKVWRNSLHLSRFFSTFLLLLFLCDFFFKTLQSQNERPLLIVALDKSASMLAAKDSSQVVSFVNKELEELKPSLSENFDISTIWFGSEVKTEISDTFRDKESDFESLFRELEERYVNRNVGAALVFSDGIQNKGSVPLSAAENLGYPVYCIGVGDTTEFRDLKISKLSHNPIAFLGNAFPVDVFVQANQLQGKTAVLKLLQNGKEIARSSFLLNSDVFASTIRFTLQAENLGINVYRAQLDIFSEEKNHQNNAQEFVVEVQDKRQKILLLGTVPHPDISALKESLLSSSAYDLDTRFTEEFTGSAEAYNLVILHGAGTSQKPLIEQCQEKGVPFWVIRPSSSDVFPGLRLNGNVSRYNDSEPAVNNNFGLFTVRTELSGFLETCPAIKCAFGKHLVSNGASCLIYQRIGSVETSEPLFLFNESSGIKSACFNGDGLWKWKMRDFAEHQNHELFNELIFATVHYLSVKNDKSQFRLRYTLIVNENEDVEMEADVYNKSYEAIHTAEVNLVLQNTKNKTFKYSFSSNGKFYQSNLGQLPPDEYTFTATSKAGDELLQKKGRLVVKEMNAEQTNLVANHRLLNQLAKRSGGAFYNMEEILQLKKDLESKKEIKTITFSVSRLNRLLDWPLVFFILLLSLGLEWAVRKRYLGI